MSRFFCLVVSLLVVAFVIPICSVAQAPYLAVANSFDFDSVVRLNAVSGAPIDVLQPLDANGQSILGDPADVAFGPDGNLYVLDAQNPFDNFTQKRGSVLKFDGTSGAFMGIFALGQGTGPFGITFGPDGNLYVSDLADRGTGQGHVMRYNGKTGAFMDDFVPCCQLSEPFGLKFGPDGNLYVTSVFQVLRFNGKTGAFMDVFATLTGLGRALVFGPDGNLYVSVLSTESEVLQFDGKGALLGPFVGTGAGGMDCPWGLAFGPDQNLYVSSAQCGHVIGTREGNQHGILRFGGPLSPRPQAFLGIFAASFDSDPNSVLGREPKGIAFSPNDCQVKVTSWKQFAPPWGEDAYDHSYRTKLFATKTAKVSQNGVLELRGRGFSCPINLSRANNNLEGLRSVINGGDCPGITTGNKVEQKFDANHNFLGWFISIYNTPCLNANCSPRNLNTISLLSLVTVPGVPTNILSPKRIREVGCTLTSVAMALDFAAVRQL